MLPINLNDFLPADPPVTLGKSDDVGPKVGGTTTTHDDGCELQSCSEKEQDGEKGGTTNGWQSDVPPSAQRSRVSLDATSTMTELPHLHQATPPMVDLKKEKYEHRIVAHLKAEGLTNVEIATHVGLTPAAINYIVKQPWCEAQILEIIHRRGGDRVEAFISEKALPAVSTLATIMENEKSANRDRIAAARELLNRKYGNPTQPITVHNKNADPKDLSDDELANIARGSRTRTTTSPNGAE